MEKQSLTAVARHVLDHARNSASGRRAETVFGGHEHSLRETVIAITRGKALAEHAGHSESTIYVLQGRIRVVTEHARWDGITGDLIVVPRTRHRVEALEDSAILLTVSI